MTNAWSAAQGVLRLKTLWAELAHLRPTAVCGPACPVVWGGRSAMTVLTRFIERLNCRASLLHIRSIAPHDVSLIPRCNLGSVQLIQQSFVV